MKKTLLSLLLTCTSATMFAALTETLNTALDPNVSGYDIAGNGSASELLNSSYNWIRLGGTLNFDDDTNIVLTSNATKLGTSGFYSFMTLDSGGAVLNFTGSGTLTTAAQAGINAYYGNLTIDIAKGAGGLITPKVCSQSLSGKGYNITLNVNENYGIRTAAGGAFILCNVSQTTINMTANLAIKSDFRSTSTLNLNISNGSYLIIEKTDQILTDGINANIKIADDTLNDGAILFAKDMVDTEYDSETGILKIFLIASGTKKVETIQILDSKGAALKNLNWSETLIEGKDYFMLTGMTIPEPAEWAAIFGAIALAFAAYRRKYTK